MNNTQILLQLKEQLIKDNIINEDNIIGTYKSLKSMGYQVKQGQKSITNVYLWKPIQKYIEEDENGKKESVEEHNKMYMIKSYIFCDSQCDKIKTIDKHINNDIKYNYQLKE